MIKGCQKRIIHVKSEKNPIFEEAYFVLRRESSSAGLEENDMIKEAMRIADEVVGSVKSKNNSRRKKRAVYFILGAAAVSFIFGAVMLYFAVIKS